MVEPGTMDDLIDAPQSTIRQPSLIERHFGNTHPIAVLFYLAFKAGGMAYYILCGWLPMNYIVNFVVVVTLLMADFWTVKNVSGRLLVGLRWWSEAGDDGNEWRFECLDDTGEDAREVSAFDSRIFWTVLYLTPVGWTGLALLAVVKLNVDYLLLAVIAVILSGSNAYGYHKCSKAQQNQLKGLVNRGIAQGVKSYFGW